ncbi:MAG: response regulator transcription factor [Myxococcota bacterium]|jgi:two-component system response regulator NreC|nr:response regulator transcription factor [Myxococcota bacterium]
MSQQVETACDTEIRVGIADDHRLVRAGLRRLLQAEPGITIVGEATTADEAIAMACREKPRVLLLDLKMGASCEASLLAIHTIVKSHSEVAIVVVTAYTEVELLLAATAAGALGIVLKDSVPSELLIAIRHASKGLPFCCEAVATAFAREGMSTRCHQTPASLTARESEILRLVAMGHSRQEIATFLGIEPRTVSTHRENLLTKLGLTSTADLTRFAISRGLIA